MRYSRFKKILEMSESDYRKTKEYKKQKDIFDKREEKEYGKVVKMIKDKDDKGLGHWLIKFAEKGCFWLGEGQAKKEKKYIKDAWL